MALHATRDRPHTPAQPLSNHPTNTYSSVTSGPLIVLITDRPSVARFLSDQGASREPPIRVTRVALSAADVRAHQADVERAAAAMIDIGSEPDEAVRVCEELREQRRDLPVMAVVCCPKPTTTWHIRGLLAGGIQDLVDSKVAPGELLDKLVALASGSRQTRIDLHDRYGSAIQAHISSEDEQLIQLVARGLSDVEIGARLNVAERTVRKRLERLKSLLDVRNRFELAAWAGAAGFYKIGS
jgi:DNA-binding NarL/FixJ family response regulator